MQKAMLRFTPLFFIFIATMTSTSQSALPDPAGELSTTLVVQADIDWLRSAKVGWDDCEAGAPIIEPIGTRLFSQRKYKRLGTLLPTFFLHARFKSGVYEIGANRPFEVTMEHITLMKTMSWRGAEVDCKRPYGEFTNFTIDMASALSLPITAGTDRIARISPQDDERMHALHQQMQSVVTAYIRHADFSPGKYLSPRDGLIPEDAARPRLVPPTQADFQKYLVDIAAARKSEESWRAYSVIAGLYSTH
jgi:hypothetical protein